MARKKADRPPDPDRLVRAEAGRYGTEDERFQVSQESANAWYVTDAQQTDELGLSRVTGPYATLAAVRAAIPALRETPAQPVSLQEHRRKRAAESPPASEAARDAPERAAKAAPKRPEKEPPATAKVPASTPKPASWLDRLEPDEGARARRLIRAAERAGLRDPEHLVRIDLQGLGPQLAPAVLLQRVWRNTISAWDADEVADAADRGRSALGDDADATEALVSDLDPDRIGALARIVARETVRRVLEIIASPDAAAGLPRWVLDEIDERGDRTGRRVGFAPDDFDCGAPKR